MADRPLSESLENYLKAIYQIVEVKQAARARDIGDRLDVGYSSVTGALKSLADKGLINYAPYDIITLTPKGKRAAQDVVRRHNALRSFLMRVLAIGEKEASETACRMEHAISKNVLERLVAYVRFVETCSLVEATWLERSGFHCEGGTNREECERCVSLLLEKRQEGGVDASGEKG